MGRNKSGIYVRVEQLIRLRRADVVVAGGTESMTRAALVSAYDPDTRSYLEPQPDAGMGGPVQGALGGQLESDKIELWRNGKQTVTVEEEVKFETEKIKDANRETSYREVKQAGENGKKNRVDADGIIEEALTGWKADLYAEASAAGDNPWFTTDGLALILGSAAGGVAGAEHALGILRLSGSLRPAREKLATRLEHAMARVVRAYTSVLDEIAIGNGRQLRLRASEYLDRV